MTTLISLSGLPGVGKTTLSRDLAARMKAIHLQVDSAEAAMKNSVLKIHPAGDAGYRVLAALAKDNLLLGFDVIVDTVNPIEVTRKLWSETAFEANASLLNVEVVCEDKTIHKKRVESRKSDIEGLALPSWENVVSRRFERWRVGRVTVDTSQNSISECATIVIKAIG